MSGKLTPELAARADAAGPQDRLKVIVKLRPGADPAALEPHGFELGFRVKSIESVTGTVRAGAVRELAALDEVAHIEGAEGGPHAL